MATTSIDNRPSLTPTVKAALGGLRMRIRLYVWLEGLACAVAWLGVAFWLSLAVDWFFEPSVSIRRVILAVVAMVLAGVLAKLIGWRAFARLTDANMATLLERRFAQLDDALLTAVVLTDRRADSAQCNPELLQRTCREAAGRIDGVRLGAVFNPLPLRRSIVAAVLLAGSIGLFEYRFPAAFAVWKERSILLADRLWPRNTRLTVDGFENNVAKVARGSDFTLVAKADMQKEFVPQVVEVRYRIEGGARGRGTMSRLGAARKGTDPFQEYSYAFQGVLAPILFDVVGGDDRIENLRIEVVESPTIRRMLLDCEFPAYMERSPRTLPQTGVMQLPLGTHITVRATANKDLARVQIDAVAGEDAMPCEILQNDPQEPPWRDFQHTLASLDTDTTLLFTLSDTDGITAREPVRLALVSIEDRPPQLALRLGGIGQAITPGASLPAAGPITDDYGVDKLWFVYAIDDEQPAERPIDLPGDNPTEIDFRAAMEVGPLKLVAGQKLLLAVKAADRRDLGEGPNLGTSERWLLDVVTPEQLRGILEARELVLRQRFERIVQEVVESRDSLLRIDFDTPQPPDNADGSSGPTSAETAPAGAEPGDEPGDAPRDKTHEELSPERQIARRLLRVQRIAQNSRKNAHETSGVADAMDDIRLQLINNGIDTEELKIRLKDQIADPLRVIAETRFPELERRLQRMQQHLDDAPLGREHRAEVRQELDAILLEMRRVLDRMIELEDFNEAVELLRAIIKLQEELDEQTRQRHKAKLRELMEDLQ